MHIQSSEWPLFGWTTDVRPTLRRLRNDGRAVVLGTLVDVTGSSPRPAGTQMVFDGHEATGYFSGGCLEADVANHAFEVQESGAPKLLVYGQGSPWIDIRLLCGGRLEILLERIAPDDSAVGRLLELERSRRPALWTSDGANREVLPLEGLLPERAWNGASYRLHHDPVWRIAIVGHDPIALAIAHLAAISGFETILIRPNGPDAGPPLQVKHYVREWPAAALAALPPDRWTAVVAATHDDELDDETIVAALESGSSYVGVLGSARRVPLRRERLLAAGLRPAQVSALHAPIGIARCGKAPWEVAVAVIAEIMEVRTDLGSFPKAGSPALADGNGAFRGARDRN